jgi:hypothetical protein
MIADEIITIIKRRREHFFDSQIAGTADDPAEYSAADVSRAIADEYDSLLAEIQEVGRSPGLHLAPSRT